MAMQQPGDQRRRHPHQRHRQREADDQHPEVMRGRCRRPRARCRATSRRRRRRSGSAPASGSCWAARRLGAPGEPATGSAVELGVELDVERIGADGAAAWPPLRSSRHSFQATQSSSRPPASTRPMTLRSSAVKTAKMMRSTAAAAMPKMIAFLRSSIGSPAAAMPTTTALSPASTRSMTMTVASAVSSEMHRVHGSTVLHGSGSGRDGSVGRDQLLVLEVAPQRAGNLGAPPVEDLVQFLRRAGAGDDARHAGWASGNRSAAAASGTSCASQTRAIALTRSSPPRGALT